MATLIDGGISSADRGRRRGEILNFYKIVKFQDRLYVVMELDDGDVAIYDYVYHDQVSQYEWKVSNGYASSSVGFMHIFILYKCENRPNPDDFPTIDHINYRQRLDNRSMQLRYASQSMQSSNTGDRKKPIPEELENYGITHFPKYLSWWQCRQHFAIEYHPAQDGKRWQGVKTSKWTVVQKYVDALAKMEQLNSDWTARHDNAFARFRDKLEEEYWIIVEAAGCARPQAEQPQAALKLPEASTLDRSLISINLVETKFTALADGIHTVMAKTFPKGTTTALFETRFLPTIQKLNWTSERPDHFFYTNKSSGIAKVPLLKEFKGTKVKLSQLVYWLNKDLDRDPEKAIIPYNTKYDDLRSSNLDAHPANTKCLQYQGLDAPLPNLKRTPKYVGINCGNKFSIYSHPAMTGRRKQEEINGKATLEGKVDRLFARLRELYEIAGLDFEQQHGRWTRLHDTYEELMAEYRHIGA